jgi:hypothetical protein
VAAETVAYPIKRRSIRYKIDVPLRVILHKTDKTVIREGRGKELSEHGVCVMVGVELVVGDEVEIEFTPPYSGEPIRVVSTVRNREGYCYGCEFLPEVQGNQHVNMRLLQALQGFAEGKSS